MPLVFKIETKFDAGLDKDFSVGAHGVKVHVGNQDDGVALRVQAAPDRPLCPAFSLPVGCIQEKGCSCIPNALSWVLSVASTTRRQILGVGPLVLRNSPMR